MDKTEEILDPEIKEWVKHYNYQVNSKQCTELAEKISISVANEILSSIIKKIGTIEGIRKANEILKSLNIDTEVELDSLTKEINSINELELKILALRTCNISKESKQKILDKYIDKFGIPENKKQETVVDLLRQEINKVYKNLGELPSNNINDVRLVKDQKKIAARPFGRKKS